jgi:hypothetical protein
MNKGVGSDGRERCPGGLPGEIGRVDLGLTAKVRPSVLISDYPAKDELALVLGVGDSQLSTNDHRLLR